MGENIFWVVYEEEKKTREWVDMPKDYIGSPLYEHATDYITILETGERVMVRKKDGYVFENSGVSSSDKSHLATPEEIEKMREDARRKAEERRRRGLQGNVPFVPTNYTNSSLPRSNGSWVVSRRDVKGRWVPMPSDYLGKPIIEYWNCYVTDLESGERVFVNKETGKITWDKLNPDSDDYHSITAEEVDFLRKEAVRRTRKRKSGYEKPIRAKSVPIEQIVKDRYDEKVPWVVDLNSSRRNIWYPMPMGYKGKPTFEYWDSYVTQLSDGKRVTISKKTNEQINKYVPVKSNPEDKSSQKRKSEVTEVAPKPKEIKGRMVAKPEKRALSSGLKVVSSKEELLDLQIKSKASHKETNKKRKE
jgi:hypothetical protein